MRYEIPKSLIGTYRQMTIPTAAALDPDGFTTEDRQEAESILELIVAEHIRDDENADYSEAELSDMFFAVFGRKPEAEEWREGVYSHICAAVARA